MMIGKDKGEANTYAMSMDERQTTLGVSFGLSRAFTSCMPPGMESLQINCVFANRSFHACTQEANRSHCGSVLVPEVKHAVASNTCQAGKGWCVTHLLGGWSWAAGTRAGSRQRIESKARLPSHHQGRKLIGTLPTFAGYSTKVKFDVSRLVAK